MTKRGEKQITLAMNKKRRGRFYLQKYWPLYLMMVPALVYTLIFKLMPLYGLIIAFKDYSIFNGKDAIEAIGNSNFVGLENFKRIFSEPGFGRVVGNTFIIAIMKLIIIFPLPILLAMFLNEIKRKHFKSTLQTIVYLPHFFSWVIVAGIFMNLLGNTGLINLLLESMGFERINFLTDVEHFRSILVISEAWKEIGFSVIVYIAAITGIDESLYEAAQVDGAGRFQKMINITLPCIIPAVTIMFIIKTGKMLEENFQQILVMYNPIVYETVDVIQTYVYRMGLGQMDYTLGVTVGLFNSVVSFGLIILANLLSKIVTGKNAL